MEWEEILSIQLGMAFDQGCFYAILTGQLDGHLAITQLGAINNRMFWGGKK
jgi:hypothetical protein